MFHLFKASIVMVDGKVSDSLDDVKKKLNCLKGSMSDSDYEKLINFVEHNWVSEKLFYNEDFTEFLPCQFTYTLIPHVGKFLKYSNILWLQCVCGARLCKTFTKCYVCNRPINEKDYKYLGPILMILLLIL